MLTILIADDEKLERNGIKFLLKREAEEFEILEASNGKDALSVLESTHVDILFSDVKMPYMNGLELTKCAREQCPELEIVIFSGYNDFSYAREALRHGVVDYVLKPVDPQEFHKTFQRVREHINDRYKEEKIETRKTDYLKKYFLVNYLYGEGDESVDRLEELFPGTKEELSGYSRMILVSAPNGLFETEEERFISSLKEEMKRELLYLNLNSNESLFFFVEECSDYRNVAEKMYRFFYQQYDTECYCVVSGVLEGWQDIREQFRRIEALLSERFYQPDRHILLSGDEREKALAEEADDSKEDAELMEHISRDIRYKDVTRLKQDFHRLENKYKRDKQFSEMYVKFVFSGILKELYEKLDDMDEKTLSRRVDRLYRCRKIQDVLEIVSEAIDEFEERIKEQSDGNREEIAKVKRFIYQHYSESTISVEEMASEVYLSPGYLSVVFKDETGVTLNRFVREVRMEKAKELLETTSKKIGQIAKEVGFTNSSYFCRSFKEFFGASPESCRKGITEDEDTSSMV